MLLARHAAAVQTCYGHETFNTHITVSTSTDASYEASRREVNAGISKLRPIWRIADLRMAVHRDNYIIVRTISEPIKMTALSFVIEDVQGAATRLSIYGFTDEVRFARLCQQFPEGTIWLIKAPFFKLAADGGRVIRVENPSNIVRLLPSDPLLAETPWYQPPASGGSEARSGAAAAGAGAAGASAAAAEAPDAERLRVQGNEHFRRGQLEEAMTCYRAAVAAEPSDHLSWGNMAQVELQQADRARERAKFEAARGHYAAALEHARMSVVIEPTFVKSAVRHARALMGLGRYAVANALVDELMLRLEAPREGPLDVKDHDAVAALHAELTGRLGLPRSRLTSFAHALSKLPAAAGTGGAAAGAAGAAGARKAPAAGGSTAATAAAGASNACEPADSFPAEMAEELRQRGNALFRRGAFAAAAAAYRGALGHVPAQPITCSNLAECELKMADATRSTAAGKAKGGAGGEAAGAEATVAAEAAAAASPAAQRHYAVALACADMALAGAPDHAKSANRRARALQGLGRSEEAAAQLRAGLAMLSSAASAAAAPPAGSAELATVMRHLLATLQPADAACSESAAAVARPAGATAGTGAAAQTPTAATAGGLVGDSVPTPARTAPAASTARAPASAAARSRAARGVRSNVAEFAEDEGAEKSPTLPASASSAARKPAAAGAAAAAAALQTCEEGPGTLNVAETPDGCSSSGISGAHNTSEVAEGYLTNAPEVPEGHCTNAPETPETAVPQGAGTLSEASAGE
jgi:tetratricopeptide (TPR) repeat protein